MKKLSVIIMSLFVLASCGSDKKWSLVSPDGRVAINVSYGSIGEDRPLNLYYTVSLNGKTVVLDSPLGIDRQDGGFSAGMKFVKESSRLIDDKYTLKSGKRLENHDFANEKTLTFSNASGQQMELMLRAYNDGVAFRYRFPEADSNEFMVIEEKTGFRMPLNGRAWIHPYDWNSRLKPSYEQYCQSDIAVGADSPYEQGWAYPMLFNVSDSWVFITEAVLDGTYCATHIRSTSDGLYKVHFAEPDEVIIPDDPQPVSTLPWATPWRVIAVGENLGDIVETTIVQSLNPPCAIGDTSWIIPGRSSWSWWSDGSTVRKYEVQKEYADFTADMGWEYMLIDAGWPGMRGGTAEQVAEYAASKDVGVWLWYHSGAGRSTDTLSYMNVMSVPEARKSEMARLEQIGVKGIKVDFFDTDKQRIVKLYEEILRDAADHKIMVNFHGATLPRGLERTYPNLMTTEAIKGAEGFGRQPSCDRAAEHNATVVFTRNVVGSMDYTPVTFSDKIRQGVPAFNRTTYPHQLALSVVFESGVQNFADKKEAYEALAQAPKEFLEKVPTAWDETKLVAGYPGDFAVLARRKGDTWWIGGINGKDETREISFELPFLPEGRSVVLLTDADERTGFALQTATTGDTVTVKMAPNGGFAGTVEL